jgi:hypothetical protein
MLGSAFNKKTREILSPLIDRFAQINQDIFEYSSQLASIPPRIAEQLQFQSWKSFVQSVTNTLELGNEILDYFLQHENYGDGLLKKMREANINDENVSRIFVDFLLAAGDTVGIFQRMLMKFFFIVLINLVIVCHTMVTLLVSKTSEMSRGCANGYQSGKQHHGI